MIMKKICLTLVCFGFFISQVIAQKITIQQQGNNITLANPFIAFTFNKTNADLTGIAYKNHSNILGKQGRAYLLGPGFSMGACDFSIVRQTDSLVEIKFIKVERNHFQYNLHYILKSTDAGIYCFLEQLHQAKDSAGNYGQTRWGLRADESLFDYHLVRDSIQGSMPPMADLKNEIQDWTYKLTDSTYYTKYDYADYIEGRHVHGMAGTKSGLGLFVIQASHEYLNGGPTKQYQNVHSNPYLICMFNCGHFLSDTRKGDNIIQDDWRKLNGPFFLYVNDGKSIDEIWKNAKQKANQEIKQWPYRWMNHPEYPIERATVKGTLLYNKTPVEKGTHLVLAAPNIDWQAQSKGYMYYATTQQNGTFTIPHVRSENYTLYAYGNNVFDEFQQANIEVKNYQVVDLKTISWQPVANFKTIWQIGKADRKTTGFNLSNSKRNYAVFLKTPANLTYVIGKSNEATDWYYAQTKEGSWDIEFNMPTIQAKTATLNLAIAGYARNPKLTVVVNDSIVATIKAGNDASVYRSAIAGGYYQLKKINFPAALLQTGKNKIQLQLSGVKNGAGVMYDALKLEIE